MTLRLKNRTRIGLISDTHCPRLIEKLPNTIFDIFADVDLILHAGDVGLLWVLDELSQLAPVVAVHGNDETKEAQQALPFLQTLSVAGQRLVLTHGHYPDMREEHESRKDDSWYPKLARWASFGREHGAKYVISGHTHIPLVTQVDGVWLVNPGSVIQGSEMFRQDVRTVAILTFFAAGDFAIDHFDAYQSGQPFTSQVNLAQGFRAARNTCMTPIIAPELEAQIHWLSEHILPVAEQSLRRSFLNLAQSRWQFGAVPITVADFLVSLHQELVHYPHLKDKLLENPVFAPYLPNGN
jgi:hypothetical protein